MARNPRSILIALVLWITIFGCMAVIVRYFVLPTFDTKIQKDLLEQTSSTGRYQHEIRLATDSFSGYSLLRSPDFSAELALESIKLTIVDDGANYLERMNALKSGSVDMAVFPINSFLQMGAQLNEFPATIVYIIDETRGADAIIANNKSIQTITDLNRKDARIVATPNSPSEFLARVMLASFNLPELPTHDWLIEADGSTAVYNRFRGEGATQPYAYALWEPQVSQATRDSDTIVLLDSSKLQGYIVDTLVVRREFLVNHYLQAKAFVEHYARIVYQKQSKMFEVITADSKAIGTPLSQQDAMGTLAGIDWKNTLENMIHFGVISDPSNLENIEDILHKILGVMTNTGLIDQDSIRNEITTLYFDQILREMYAEKFHPGRSLNIISSIASERGEESLKAAIELRELSPEQWASLVSVGELRVEPIRFGRGTDRINLQSKRDLVALAQILKSFPQYYLIITGRVRSGGDETAAINLAKSRAEASLQVLLEHGVAKERMKTAAEIDSSDNMVAQSVAFLVGQLPY